VPKDNKKNVINKKSTNKINYEILLYNDLELNLLTYEEALIYDKRSYCQYYLSLLRTKHILFFTFYKGNDYNLRSIKIYLFFFTFAINYSISILFYNYDTLHKIYEEEGAFNLVYQIPQILYSSLITGFLSSLITRLGLCEMNILEIKKTNARNIDSVSQRVLNNICYKFVLFFFVNYFLLFFFWIYSTSFSLVYKNTQIHLLKDSIISFSTSFIKPFIIYLFPGFFRISSLKKNKSKKKYMFNFSKFLQIF
jgi:hypothetical protein